MTKFSLASPSEIMNSTNLRQQWGSLLSSSNNLELLYQSPEWFEHLLFTNSDNKLSLEVYKDDAGHLLGIVPILTSKYWLKFDISARTLWKTPLNTAYMLGSQPLVPNDNDIYNLLFEAIWRDFPQCDCVYMDSLPTDSFLWNFLRKFVAKQRNYMLFILDGVRQYHSLALPPTFDEYLSSFKRKKRYNLERQVRMLRNHGAGALDMIRVDMESQIPDFLEGAVSVARNSWQQNRIGTRIDKGQERFEKLKDLARKGLLRSYLLICGHKPSAFILGYQFRDVYHYVEIAYDQSLSKLSPGTVLLYLLVEDLINHNPPKRVTFGVGHASYKQEFGNIHQEDASVLLLRKTIANRIRTVSHSSFRSLIRAVRKHIRANN